MMAFSVPAHKQTDPAKKPGQIVNPLEAHHEALKGLTGKERQAKKSELFAYAYGAHGHFPMGPK